MYVSSRDFIHQSLMPPKYTCDGANISPSLVIQGVPNGTQCLVVIMESLGLFSEVKKSSSHSHKKLPSKVHWLVWNVPPDVGFIPEGTVPKGATVGINDFWEPGYGGPYPPPGECHQYRITVYALDTSLNLSSATPPKKLLETIQPHILDQDELIGLYKRH